MKRNFCQSGLRRAPQQFGPFANPLGLDEDVEDSEPAKPKPEPESRLSGTLYKMFESAATTFASIAVLGLAGYGYHRYYKHLVLKKIENAFKPGDPVLELAALGKSATGSSTHISGGEDAEDEQNWILRPEQDRIDAIVNGTDRGKYFLLIGEKGTGKSSMLLEAMRKVDGEGISMFEAHADLEIFRIRLGKALDYEYHEDYIGSLFSIRGPRDTTALLDIERAFNKLEKIAMQRRKRSKGPLVLIINCTHLIRDDEDGRDLLEMMQQRAEQWSASNLVTMVFNSDDYWVYERLKRYATRMEVLPVLDLPKDRAIAALEKYRARYFPDQTLSSEILTKVYDRVGGRLTFLNRVAKSRDMLHMCDRICEGEKTWFLNKCGILGEEMDDDVMDQQKYASAAMVLAKALVDAQDDMEVSYDPEQGHKLPQIPLYKARQIMTRADFIQSYDHDNIFTIDSRANVRADSVPMMNALRDICSEEGFDEYLEATLDRISAIESLNRTKELTLKDLWFEQRGDIRGKYLAVIKDSKGRETGSLEFAVKPDEEADDEDK
jgi:AAA ATPase domain